MSDLRARENKPRLRSLGLRLLLPLHLRGLPRCCRAVLTRCRCSTSRSTNGAPWRSRPAPSSRLGSSTKT